MLYKGYPIKPNTLQREVIDQVLTDDAFYKVLCISRQSGKALEENTYILTPDGRKKIKDLKIGDKVLSPSGGTTTVIDKIKVEGQYYQIKSKYRTLIAHEDHVHSVKYKPRERLYTTKQIYEYDYRNISWHNKFRVDHDPKDLPLDPFLFGQLLYNKVVANNFHNKELAENTTRYYKNSIQPNKYHPREKYNIDIDEIIPIFLYNIKEVREEVCRAFMSDGKLNNNGKIIINQSGKFDEKHIDYILKFLYSIGYKAHLTSTNYIYYTTTRDHITSIDKIYQNTVGYCISVDKEDGLYITDDYVVTHNSTLAAVHMLKISTQFKNQTILYIAPSFSLCSEMITKFKDLENQPYIKEVNSSKHEVIFKNGSRIIFRSAEQKNRLRGLSPNYVVLDEAAFIPDEFIQEVVIPMLTSAGKEMLMISTPNGLDNIFHRYFEKGQRKQTDGLKYKSYQGNYFKNEFANLELIKDQKRSLPAIKFKQEYLAEFAYDSEVFDDINGSIWQPPEENKDDMYVGIDIGIRHDYTFIVYMDKNYKIHKVFYRTKFSNLESCTNWVIDVLDKNPFKKVVIEENNFGIAVYEAVLKKYNKKVDSFQTKTNTKWEIIEFMISQYENGVLKLIDNTELISHFRDFQIDTAKASGKKIYRYAAKPGGYDDGVMATAFACECVRLYGKKKKIKRVWSA